MMLCHRYHKTISIQKVNTQFISICKCLYTKIKFSQNLKKKINNEHQRLNLYLAFNSDVYQPADPDLRQCPNSLCIWQWYKCLERLQREFLSSYVSKLPLIGMSEKSISPKL